MIRQQQQYNGAKVTPAFSPAEMQRRQQKLRDWMAENAVDAVIFNSIHNINYFEAIKIYKEGQLL